MLADFIAQHIQVPVETLDLGTLFDFSETPELARKENQAPYFFALGAALRFMNKTA
jgi:MSHA biogenesis protein MshI